MARKNSNGRERENADALERLTIAAARDLERVRQAADFAATAIEQDELDSHRGFYDGGAIHVSAPPPGQILDSPDPLAGLYAIRERLMKKLDHIEERKKYAGTERALAGAERNEDAVWRELQELNARIDERRANARAAGVMGLCTSCESEYDKSDPDAWASFCGQCIHNSQPKGR
jgi:hypothetical protein